MRSSTPLGDYALPAPPPMEATLMPAGMRLLRDELNVASAAEALRNLPERNQDETAVVLLGDCVREAGYIDGCCWVTEDVWRTVQGWLQHIVNGEVCAEITHAPSAYVARRTLARLLLEKAAAFAESDASGEWAALEV